jgi:hypothetical protein
VTGKRCSTCREIKPLEDFNRLKKAPDGRQFNCRECNKAYHYANWDRHMEQIRRRTAAQIETNQRVIVEHLVSHPCVDCGERDIVVLEFDHIGPKSAIVSSLVGHSTKRLLAEIAMCEVRCANCHRRATAQRAGWDRRPKGSADPPVGC